LPNAAAVIALRTLASSTIVISLKPMGPALLLPDFIHQYSVADLSGGALLKPNEERAGQRAAVSMPLF
jgi:hypothetical protein